MCDTNIRYRYYFQIFLVVDFSGATDELIDQTNAFGLTVSTATMKRLTQSELDTHNSALSYIGSCTATGQKCNLSDLHEKPHIHLGESNFPTKLVQNG